MGRKLLNKAKSGINYINSLPDNKQQAFWTSVYAVSLAVIVLVFMAVHHMSISTEYKDMRRSFWGCDAILDMADRGVLDDAEREGYIDPLGFIDQDEFLDMLAILYGYKPQSSVSTVNLSTGTGHGSPACRHLTRYDTAQILYNFLIANGCVDKEALAQKVQAADMEGIPQEYVPAVITMNEYGLMTGADVLHFGGNRELNRAEAATVFQRILHIVPATDIFKSFETTVFR